MTAIRRRVLLVCVLLCPSAGVMPADAQEHGRVRLEGELRPGMPAADARGLFAEPLPPGPAMSQLGGPRAVSAYAPEQRVRLKQMNFTGAQ
jgi:hypothetical protein